MTIPYLLESFFVATILTNKNTVVCDFFFLKPIQDVV